jgi:hypothetical protein
MTACSGACTGGACGAQGPCAPGARRCNGDVSEQCSGDGSTWAGVQACATYCAGAGQCALDGLLVTTAIDLDGVVYVKGEAHVFPGGSISSPTGDLTIFADTITVDQGGVITMAPTGMSPWGTGGEGSIKHYSSGSPSCVDTANGGGYGTPGIDGFSSLRPGVSGGPAWNTSDWNLLAGSPGGPVREFSDNVDMGQPAIPGPPGGGVLRLVSTATTTIGGQLVADGQAAVTYGAFPNFAMACGPPAGGSSGGAIVIAGPSVTVTGTLSVAGGNNDQPAFYRTGGLGRVKIDASSASVTGTVTGVVTQSLPPPLSITSASHPDQAAIYNDGGGDLLLAWTRPFAGVQGYYARLDTTAMNPPTAGTGQFVATDATTFPRDSLAAGDNYFHIVSIDAQATVGTLENVLHVAINAAPPAVVSPSHPDPNTWNANTTPTFTWTFPQGDANATGLYYVVDHNGLTIPDASATFVSATQKTVLVPNLSPGIWVFHAVSADTRGYLTKAAADYRVKIGADPGSGSIVGTVTNGSGSPIGGAALSINNGLFTQTANASGTYNFAAVPVGTWQLSASSGGRSATRSVAVTAGGVATANLALP